MYAHQDIAFYIFQALNQSSFVRIHVRNSYFYYLYVAPIEY